MHDHIISRLLLEAVQMNIDDVRSRACVYGSQSSSEPQIKQQVYVENWEDMGIKGWTIGAYCVNTDAYGSDAPILICAIFLSDNEIDPHILKRQSF